MPFLIELVLMIFTLGAFTAVPYTRQRFGSLWAGMVLIVIIVGNAGFWTDRLDFLKPVNVFSNSNQSLYDLFRWMRQAKQPLNNENHGVINTPASPEYESHAPIKQESASAQLQTVTDFFHALGRSDGFTASNLLLPKNRGSGELADREFDKFSQMLTQPLHLEYVLALQTNLVKAKYSYIRQDGLTCNGIAYVSLSKQDNIWLISDIRGTKC